MKKTIIVLFLISCTMIGTFLHKYTLLKVYNTKTNPIHQFSITFSSEDIKLPKSNIPLYLSILPLENNTLIYTSIINKNYDNILQNWGKQLIKHSKPIYITFAPNANTHVPWNVYENKITKDTYNQAWNHIISVLETFAPNKIKWVYETHLIPDWYRQKTKPFQMLPQDKNIDFVTLNLDNIKTKDTNNFSELEQCIHHYIRHHSDLNKYPLILKNIPSELFTKTLSSQLMTALNNTQVIIQTKDFRKKNLNAKHIQIGRLKTHIFNWGSSFTIKQGAYNYQSKQDFFIKTEQTSTHLNISITDNEITHYKPNSTSIPDTIYLNILSDNITKKQFRIYLDNHTSIVTNLNTFQDISSNLMFHNAYHYTMSIPLSELEIRYQTDRIKLDIYDSDPKDIGITQLELTL